MVVCMIRENCVKLDDALTALPDCPEVKIVMTGDITKDPKAWSEAGHLSTKARRNEIKKRMCDVDDPLKIVIVCDMWLTGTDIPCLHTLYIDKPMQGHTIIQAISRVNRVFKDKPHGLIVDYIGIGEQLREATATYTKGGGRGDPAPSVEESAKPLFLIGSRRQDCACRPSHTTRRAGPHRAVPVRSWGFDFRLVSVMQLEPDSCLLRRRCGQASLE